MLRVVDFQDLWKALQSQVAQDKRLKLSLKIARDCLFFVIFDTVDPESDDMLVAVLIGDHYVDLVTEDLGQSLVYLCHLKTFMHHLVSIQLKSEEPRALGTFSCHIVCLHIVVELDKDFVIGNDCALWVRIVIDG